MFVHTPRVEYILLRGKRISFVAGAARRVDILPEKRRTSSREALMPACRYFSVRGALLPACRYFSIGGAL